MVKILNQKYSQREGREELFERGQERAGRWLAYVCDCLHASGGELKGDFLDIGLSTSQNVVSPGGNLPL